MRMSKNPPVLDENKKKKKKKVKPEDVVEIFTVLFIMFLATFGSFFALRFSTGTKLPMVVVISDSMEPTIYRGDLLFLVGKDPADIQNGSYQGDPLGDIIVFEADWSLSGEPIVHRVIDKRFNYAGSGIWEFKTQGDNNLGVDPWTIASGDIIGRESGILRGIGGFFLWVKTPAGVATLGAILVAYMFWPNIMQTIGGKRE